MTTARPNDEAIFHAARDIPDLERRREYVREACGGDETLIAHVEALLAAADSPDSLLDRPPEGDPVATIDQPTTESPGTVIGPYKLLQQIGEGGMGTVFMAEQTHPVQRKVALKVIKPGMDSGQVIARFEAERQALAMMDHVNIARVFDAGATEAGRPYFVMELVHGVPITKYCDDNHLTPRERLELFVPVCQAIQHAHQKGIIHRDIKPSNVMVTLYDGKPVPKVIDFGVAKATEQKLTQRTLFTQFGTMIGTLEYMSPEQAEMSALGVDTRSDVYSLGVLLYELLTGSTPLTHKRMKEAAYAEILRMIKEEEPPKPSTRLSDSGEALASISALRHMEPAKLTKLVRGELDWIVMKTLEKDRNRRYETANGFALDVQRYLADEPVWACPPSVGYRLRKLVRRNRAVLAGTVVVAAALLTTFMALVLSNISIRQEEKEKSNALIAKDDALRKAEANLALILAALDEVYITEAEQRFNAYRSEPKKPAVTLDPRQAQLERDFLQKGLGFYEKLIQPGSAEPAARFQTGKAYRRVGILQRELKQFDKAADSLEKAIALLEKLVEESPMESPYRSELAEAYRWRGQMGGYTLTERPDRLAEGEQAYRLAVTLGDELVAAFPASPEHKMHAATYHHELGGVLRFMGQAEKAEAEYRGALKLWQALEAAFPENSWYRHELAFTLDSLGWLWDEMAQLAKAEPFIRQAIVCHQNLVAEYPTYTDNYVRLADTQQHLASVLTRTGQLPEAEKTLQAALDVWEKLAAEFPANTEYQQRLTAVKNEASALRAQKKVLPAIAAAREAIELEPKNARAYYKLGSALRGQKMLAEAVAEYRKGIELDPKPAYARFELGNILLFDQGELDAAIAEFRKAIELEPNSKFAAVAYFRLGKALERQGNLDESIACFRKVARLDPNFAAAQISLAWLLTTCREVKLRDAPGGLEAARKAVELEQSRWTWQVLGWAHYRSADWKASIEALEKSCALDDPKGGDAAQWFFLAMAHWRLGERNKAREWYDRAVQWMDKNNPRDELLRRFRAEASVLLELKEKQ